MIPFVCSCLGAGCGGAFMKLAGVRAIGQGLTGILGLLIVVPNKLVFYVIWKPDRIYRTNRTDRYL